MTDDAKRLLIIIAIAILLALLLIFLVLLGGGNNQETGQNVAPFDIAGGRRDVSDIQGGTPLPGGPGQPAFETPQESRSNSSWGSIFGGTGGSSQGFSGPARSQTTTYYEGGLGDRNAGYSISLSDIFSAFDFGRATTTTSGTGSTGTFDGVTTPRGGDMWPSQGDGIIRGGGDPSGGGRPDFEFDPATGNARIGDYYFAFARGTIADSTTSNYVGDPDNMVVGHVIGLFIGSVIGAPDIGLNLGTAIGSNLFPGYRLSDFGIVVEQGMPTFNGYSPIGGLGGGNILGGGSEGGLGGGGCVAGAAGSAAGGAVGGSTGSSVGGAAAGGSFFGGYVVAIPCTCTATDVWWTVSKTEFSGTYLYTADAKLYEYYVPVGAFWAVGSNDSGTANCSMTSGNSCIDIPMTCGELNSSPGTGTSGFGI